MKTFSKSKQYIAFTLAEVLIVLAIIGVIAALVIPPLVENYQKTQYVVGLKKAYTELSQAFKLYMADEGVTDLSQTPLYSGDWNYPELKKVLYKYFKVTKYCYYGTECKITEAYLDTSLGNVGDEFTSYSSIYTADGMVFNFALKEGQTSCKPDYSNPSNMKGYCMLVEVDINGSNPPNIKGRDYFEGLIIAPDGNVYPYNAREFGQYWQYMTTGSIDGWEGHNWGACGTRGSSNIKGLSGGNCSARIRDEGWQMNY